jgi:hypothetical protein
MLFFDVSNNSVAGLKLFATLLIDDIQYGKIGKNWWGNLTMFNAGLYSANLYNILPIDFRFEYMRIEPYTFTHRLRRNNFTHYGYNINAAIQPNSELFFVQINYRFNKDLELNLKYSYVTHGANFLNGDGSVKENVGGDITLGHRNSDPVTAYFLNGDLEILRTLNFLISFEPVNQIFLFLNLNYLNHDLKTSNSIDDLQGFVTLNMKF